jgi:hypothetical protein
LITTWDQIHNNGASYGDSSPRKVIKSSSNPSAGEIYTLASHLTNPFILLLTLSVATDRKWRNNNGVAAEPWISLYAFAPELNSWD